MKNLLKPLSLLLLFCLMTVAAFAQAHIVKGTVTDANGEPIIGATVMESGTTNGMATDMDGNYSLKVSNKAILVVSFVSYQTQKIPVNGRSVINVQLQEDAEMLDDVVVVGYGTARKSDVTGSIASMGGEKLREIPATNVTYALQDRVAGVDLQQTSSKPGATLQIRIRGTRSLTASNDPLVVLDGIPFMGNLSDINPSDIKSMDILKDASATAIYGSRGANGVILITTVKGIEGQKVKVTYNGYAGVKKIFSQYDMMDAEQFNKMRAYAGFYQNTLDESPETNTDWQDLFYRNGYVQSHDVGVQGGTKAGAFGFGAGYYKDQGIVPTQNYSRISLRGTFESKVGEYFKAGFTTNTNYNVTKGGQVGLYNMLASSPMASPYDEDGNLRKTFKMPLDEHVVYTRESVEKLGDSWLNETKAFGTYNNLFAEVTTPWIEGLKYRINLGLNYRNSKSGAFTGQGVNSPNDKTESTASLTQSETTNWAVENLLSYDRTFGKHQISAVGMYSVEETKYSKSSVAGKDIPAEYFLFYNIGRAEGTVTVDPNNWDYYNSGLVSWMGRVMYTYDNRYMLSATVRSDGTSRLASSKRWHTYPAVSAGWNINKEAFMDNVEWIDQLKLRFGFGQTSNQAVNPYSTLGRLSTRPYNFGSNYATGYYVSSLANSELGWEYSKTWNYGIDFSVFQGRLSGNVEYYIQKTEDLLLNVNLPGTAGVSSYMGNVGKTQNKGLEITLNGTILEDYNGWDWTASLNVSANRNKLTSLASGQDRDEGNAWFIGYPIDCVYDYKKIGLWQQDDPYLDILEPGGNPGMIKVLYTGDYNEDGTPTRKIGPEDRQIIKVEPKFQGGFSTNVSWQGIDLGIITAFKAGGKLLCTVYDSHGYLNMLSGRRNNVDVDYWTEDNPGAKYPKPGGIMSGDNPKYGSTLGLFNASYWKVRSITLGYNFKHCKALLNKSGISALRVYTTVQNPFVIYSPFHKETGLDPETNSYANQNVAVSSGLQSRMLSVSANSPSTRNFVIGLNLTF